MKSMMRLVLTLFLICALVAAALAGVDAITKDRIATARQEKQEKAIAQVLPDGKNLLSVPYQDETGLIKEVLAPDGNSQSGMLAVQVEVPGFGGLISMIVGIQDGTPSGVSLVSHSETPNLGAVAGENSQKGQAFRNQFIGKQSPLAVNKDGGQIDAITSATITSRAVTRGVNAALRCAASLQEGGPA